MLSMIALIVTALVGLHLASATFFDDAAWLPSLRLWPLKHSEDALQAFLAQVQTRDYNTPAIGALSDRPGEPLQGAPRGYRVNERRELLGHGEHCYRRAVAALRDRSVVSGMGWASLPCTERDAKSWLPGKTPLLTLVKCYGIVWIASPCRVVQTAWDRKMPSSRSSQGDGGSGTGIFSSVTWGTITGSLLAGEERLKVELWPAKKSRGGVSGSSSSTSSISSGGGESSEVWVDLVSVSAPAGLLGRVAWPFVRPMQRAFFRGIASNMRRIAAEEP